MRAFQYGDQSRPFADGRLGIQAVANLVKAVVGATHHCRKAAAGFGIGVNRAVEMRVFDEGVGRQPGELQQAVPLEAQAGAPASAVWFAKRTVRYAGIEIATANPPVAP